MTYLLGDIISPRHPCLEMCFVDLDAVTVVVFLMVNLFVGREY